MKTKIFSLLVIAIFAISTTTMAQKPEQRKGKQRGEKCMQRPHDKRECMKNIFTDEQQEKVKSFHLESAKEIKPLRNQLNELKAHQQTLATADNADIKAIYKNIDKMAELKVKIQKIKASEHQKIRSILTEEQLIKFDSMKRPSARHKKMGERPMHQQMDMPEPEEE